MRHWDSRIGKLLLPFVLLPLQAMQKRVRMILVSTALMKYLHSTLPFHYQGWQYYKFLASSPSLPQLFPPSYSSPANIVTLAMKKVLPCGRFLDHFQTCNIKVESPLVEIGKTQYNEPKYCGHSATIWCALCYGRFVFSKTQVWIQVDRACVL